MGIKKFIFFLLPGLALGCTAGPDYKRPDVKAPLSWNSSERIENVEVGWPKFDWWKEFSSPELESLINVALKNNPDIKGALSRIEQARASSKIVRGNLFPFINVETGVGRSKKSESQNKNDGSTSSSSSYEMLLAASYEVDLWGKYRRMKESADGHIVRNIYDQQAIALMLTADIATQYFEWLAFNDCYEIAQRMVQAEKKMIDIMDKRYKAGMISGLDLAQAKANLTAVETTLPAIAQQRQQTLHTLAILLGHYPGEVTMSEGSLMKAMIPPVIPTGLPSGLLERRPDLQRAEAELKAANADIGVAKAAMFPTIQLTAQGGYTSLSLSSLIRPENTVYTIGASLLGSIFQGGRLRGEYERSKARYEELLQNYHKAVLSAFRGVEDALVAIEKLAEQEKLQMEGIAQTKRAYDLAERSYHAGLTDLIRVLEAGKVMLRAENDLVQTRLNRLKAMVKLYMELGGGW